ncbi:hypothetical protein Tco_0944447 [Tanacetum coccineum]
MSVGKSWAIGDGISDTSMGLSSVPRGCQGMMIKILRVRYVNGSSEVTDENGTIIGTEMTYALIPSPVMLHTLCKTS